MTDRQPEELEAQPLTTDQAFAIGYERGRNDERTRVAAWMRTPVEWTEDPTEYAEARGMSMDQIEWIMRRTLDTTAVQIERGEHEANP